MTPPPEPSKVGGRLLPLLLLLTLLAAWTLAGVTLSRRTGFLNLVGVDFSHYWVMWYGYRVSPEIMYHKPMLERYRRHILNMYSPREPALRVSECGTPYPPIYGALFSVLSRAKPHQAWALWMLLQSAVGAWLGWRTAAFFPPPRRWLAFVIAFASYPVLSALFVGQFQLVSAVCLGECFLALRRGRDLRAGLWLAALALKPHYAVVIGLLLLWKRRWWAVLGAAGGVGLIALSSLLAAGPRAMLGYPRLMFEIEKCAPADMVFIIGWRSLVGWVAPLLDSSAHFGAVAPLAMAGIVAALLASAGPWRPQDPKFALSFSAIVIATLLAGYHTDSYGHAVLLVPLGAAIAGAHRHRALALVAAATAVVPSIWFVGQTATPLRHSLLGMVGSARLSTMGLVLLLVLLLAEFRAAVRSTGGSDSAIPPSQPL